MFIPQIIYEYKEGEKTFYLIKNNGGFFPKKEEIEKIISGLQLFIDEYGNQIDQLNENIEIKHKQEYEEWHKQQKENKKEKNRIIAQIYIIECNGRYKVGMSKNIENRLKQLDNRPFPCNIIFKSSDTKYAYEIEQEIHFRLTKRRIKGEWYDMPQEIVEKVKNEIEFLIDKYNNGVYNPERLIQLRRVYGE